MRALIAITVCAVLLTGCGGGNNHEGAASPHTYASLHVAPINATVRTGTVARFIAVGMRADRSADSSWDLLSPAGAVQWQSSSAGTVSIDSHGNIVANQAGNTTITGSVDGLAASTVLVVSDSAPTLTRVEMDFGLPHFNNSVLVGQQFGATAYYDDGSTAEITTEGIWASSDVSAATVDASGMVTFKTTKEFTLYFYYGLSYNAVRIAQRP